MVGPVLGPDCPQAPPCDRAPGGAAPTLQDSFGLVGPPMASTPSASSLSAVLRCRGDIWTRKPPAKRPAAAHSLALSSAELSAPNRGSERSISPREERRVAGRGLSVACRWETGEEEKSVGDVNRIKDRFYDRKFAQPAARSAPPGGGELVIKPETAAAHRIRQLPPGVLKLTLTVPVLPETFPVSLTWLRPRTGDPLLHRNQTQQARESSRSGSGPEVKPDTPD